MAQLFGFDYKSPYFYPRFGSRAGSFLTQRRKGAEKTARFEFFESYLLLHHTSDTQLVKIHSVRKILAFFIFPQNFTFSLRYSASLRLCVKINSRF